VQEDLGEGGRRLGSDDWCVVGEEIAGLEQWEGTDVIDVGVGEKDGVELLGLEATEIGILGTMGLFDAAIDEIVLVFGGKLVATATDLLSTAPNGDLHGFCVGEWPVS
jgi:hypothetical protein